MSELVSQYPQFRPYRKLYRHLQTIRNDAHKVIEEILLIFTERHKAFHEKQIIKRIMQYANYDFPFYEIDKDTMDFPEGLPIVLTNEDRHTMDACIRLIPADSWSCQEWNFETLEQLASIQKKYGYLSVRHWDFLCHNESVFEASEILGRIKALIKVMDYIFTEYIKFNLN